MDLVNFFRIYWEMISINAGTNFTLIGCEISEKYAFKVISICEIVEKCELCGTSALYSICI